MQKFAQPQRHHHQRGQPEHRHLHMVDVIYDPHQDIFQQTAEGIADQGENDGPDRRANGIEQKKLPRADIRRTEHERGQITQSVEKAERKNEHFMIFLEHDMDPFGPGPPFLTAGHELLAPVASHEKGRLVPGQTPGESRYDDPGQVEMKLRRMRGEAGQEQNGLTLEKGADKKRDVAILLDDVLEKLDGHASILGGRPRFPGGLRVLLQGSSRRFQAFCPPHWRSPSGKMSVAA